MDIINILQTFGVPMGLVIVFIAWSYVREKGLVKKIDKLDEFQRGEFTRLITESTVALSQNTRALEQTQIALGALNGNHR